MMQAHAPLPLFAGFGIEIEYMITDRERLNVMPVTDEVFKSVAGDYVSDIEDGPIGWSNELVLHVLELKTNGPVNSLNGLHEKFLADVRRINTILENMNGWLMPAAMHPWMNPDQDMRLWPHESSEIYAAFNRIFNCRGHGWSNLQSMHINLPFADDAEFAQLHAAIRILLPIMPALAASSPIMEGQYTGLMDTRLDTYRRNSEKIPQITGMIIPEPVTTHAEYQQRILTPIYSALAPHDPEGTLLHEWVNARGAIARFERNTIEIRVLDTQETPLADIAIAALIVAVLKKLVAGEWAEMPEQNQLSTKVLAEILMFTIKDAELAVIKNKAFLELFEFPDRKCQTQELWQHLLESVPVNDPDLTADLRKAVHYMIYCGPLARRINLAIGNNLQRSRLEETWHRLCECLAQGHLFKGID